MENDEKVMITMSLADLERLLWQQKEAIGDYMTRNLSTYKWYNDHCATIDNEEARKSLVDQVNKSPFAQDFKTLQKYHR